MTPRDLGLPFDSWRTNQLSTAQQLASSTAHTDILRAPPGSGKTCIYFTATQLRALKLPAHRTLVLTSTRKLQDQIYNDFGPIGLVDVRGKSNYPCNEISGLQCDHHRAPCNAGDRCMRKDQGCAYYDAIRKAKAASHVVTSYAFYLHRALLGGDLGTFDTLVCDEAHLAFDWLTNVLSFTIDNNTVQELTGAELLVTDNVSALRGWAYGAIDTLRAEYAANRSDIRYCRRLEQLGKCLARFTTADVNWVADVDNDTVTLRPVNPGDAFGHLLYGRAKRTILCSATVYRTDAALLGLHSVNEVSMPSTFPARNRPIVFYATSPAVRMSHKTTDAEFATVVSRMDDVIESLPAQNGLVQCTSYSQAWRIREHSRVADRLLIATRRNDKLATFATSTGKVLVSPVVKEGVDFPHDACRFVLFPKVPFPHTHDKLTVARAAVNRDYIQHLTLRTFVQMSLRAVRAPDDYCLIVLFDGHFHNWLCRVQSRLEPWFVEAISATTALPTMEVNDE